MEPVQLVVRATARLYQRISALFILSGAFVGLSFFLLYFLVNSSYLFPLFDGIVNPEFRGRIGFERVTWGPAPWSFKVLRPKVWRPDGKEVFRAESFVVDEVHLGALLSRNIEVSGLVVEAGRVDLTARLSQESLDWRGAPKPLFDIEEAFWPPGPRYDDGEKVGVTVNVSDIAFRDFSLRLDTPEAGVLQENISIEGARFEAEPDTERVRMGLGRFIAGPGELRVRREDDGPPPLEGDAESYYHWPLSNFRLTNYTWRDDVFTVGTAAVVVNGDLVEVDHFRMDLSVPGTPDMAGKVHVEIADLSRQLTQFGLSEVRGPVTLDLSGRGPSDAFAGEFSLDGEQLSVFGEMVDRLRLRGRKAAVGLIELDRLELTTLTGLIEGRADFDPEKGRLAAELSLDGIDITALQRPLPHLVDTLAVGRWKGELRFRGRDLMSDAPEFATDGRLRSTANVRRGQGLGKAVDLEWAVAINEPIISVYTFVLLSEQLKVTGAGRLDLKGDGSDLKGKLDVRDLSLVTRDLGLDLGGALQAPWTLKGRITSPRVEAGVEAKQLRYADFPPADFDSRLTYDRGRLIFEPGGTELRIGEGKAVLRGHVDVDKPNTPLDLRVSARALDLASFPLGMSARGRVGADVKLAGPTNGLTIGGQVMVRKPCVTLPNGEQICFRRVDADGAWRGDDIDVTCITVGNPRKPMVMATGNVDLTSRTFTANLNLSELPLPLVARATRPIGEKAAPLRGAVSLELEAQGEFERPTGTGTLEIKGLGFDQYTFGDGRLAIDAEGEVVSLAGKVFEKFQISAGIPTIPQGRLANAEVTFDALALEDFLPQLADLPIETQLGGRVEAKANLFQGQLHGVTAQLDQLQTAYTVATETGPRAKATAQSFVIANVEPIKISLRHEVLNVENFLLSVDRAGGVIARSSPSAALAPIAGRSLGAPAGVPAGVVNAAASLALPVLEGSTLPMNETRVKVTGTVGTDQTLDLTVLGIVDLDLIQPFLRSVFTEMSGYSRFVLQLGGATDDLLPEGILLLYPMQAVPRSSVVGGQIELREVTAFGIQPQVGPFFREDGTLMGGVIDVRLTDVDEYGEPIASAPKPMRLLRDESELTVSDIVVEFEEFAPYRVELNASFTEQEVNIPRVLRATVGGNGVKFEMSQKGEDGRTLKEPVFALSGDLNVLWGEYVADVDIQPTSAVTDSVIGKTQQQSVDVFEENPALRRLKLDLSLVGDGDFHIENKISELALDLDIRLDLDRIYGFLAPQPETDALADGTWEPLEIVGRVTVLPDSTLTYANQEFAVSQGAVDFTENDFVNAVVEAKRDYQVGGTSPEEVRLTVTYVQQTPASPPDYRLSWTSDSGLSQLEVATLVLTGRPPSDITGAAGASGAAAGFLLAPIMNLVERPLEDTFDLKLDLTPDSSGQLAIDSELKLSQRLTLSTMVLVGSTDKNFGLEYKLNNILVFEFKNEQTETDDEGTLRLRGTWELD